MSCFVWPTVYFQSYKYNCYTSRKSILKSTITHNEIFLRIGDIPHLYSVGPPWLAAHFLAPQPVFKVTTSIHDNDKPQCSDIWMMKLFTRLTSFLGSRFSLTLWQDSVQPNISDLLFIRDNSHPARVYYDIYEPTLSAFKEAARKDGRVILLQTYTVYTFLFEFVDEWFSSVSFVMTG